MICLIDSSMFEIYGREGLATFATPPVLAGVGVVLLLFGRKLYWLAVGAVGFVFGFILAQRFLELDDARVALAVGVVAGLVFAASAALFQKLAVATLGFVAGGLALLYVAATLQWQAGPWLLVGALAAGIAGALLARSLFELALALSTAVAGAALCVPVLDVGPELELPVLAGLAAVGTVVQLSFGRKRKSKD